MRHLAAIIFTGVFCVAAPAQSRLSTLPSDSGLVFGVEWRRVINSPVGASLVAQLEKSPLSKIPEFKGFQDLLLHNVDSVIISVPTSGLNPSVEQPPALVIVKGRFDRVQLRKMLATKGQVVEKYNTVELLVSPGSGAKSKPGATRVALLDASTIIAGDRGQVRAAIDRIKTGGTGQAPLGILADATRLSGTNDLWMILNLPPDATKDAPPAVAQMLSGVKSAELGVSFGDGIAMETNFLTKDDAAAQALAQGMQGLIALAALNQDESSKTAMETLKRVHITNVGPLVKLELALDKAELDKLMLERNTPRQPTSITSIPAPGALGRPEPARPEPARPAPAPSNMIRISGLDGGPVEIPLTKVK